MSFYINRLLPKISVIIPVYKVEPYLRQCIDSILTQSYSNLEIILVDDGSPDNCGKICDEYAEKDNRINVIHKENEGQAAARNTGINKATGEYLTFVDSDDWVAPDILELLYTSLISNNADVSCCGYYLAYSNMYKTFNCSNKILVLNREQAIEQMLLNKNVFCSVWGKLYKKSLFDVIRFPCGISYGEDAAVTFNVLSIIECVVSNNIPKYYYRQRKGSLVSMNYNSKKMEILNNAERILKVIENNYPNITDVAAASLLRANLDVLSRIVLTPEYNRMPEYRIISAKLRENFGFMIKSNVFTSNEKIKITAIKINIRLYKLLQVINNFRKNRKLFKITES
jgi:glycosyltransferase involved in cell wall biosynthesis